MTERASDLLSELADRLSANATESGLVAAESVRAIEPDLLVDRAEFPRDKACGDLIGPRGVQVLDELGIDLPDALRLGDMAVIGPSGSRVVLPAVPGRTYPGHALAVRRTQFDHV